MLLPTIQQLLNDYYDPYLKTTWGEAKVIKRCELAGEQLHIAITLGYPLAQPDQLLAPLKTSLAAISNLPPIDLQLTSRIEPHVTQPNVPALPNVKNVIAVGSGKGGVGKSTTTVNLALALLAEGARVGVLDADIYGPNQPLMLGGQQRLQLESGQPLPPVWLYGLQTMSMGYLIDPATPMIWRGPMVSSALQQLARDTAWEDLDYLFVDLPPGTGDIQLTLAQKIPVAGAVIVTTPQDVALIDARKGLEMFRKVNVPVMGIVENMGMHICSQCGHREAIFGAEGAQQLAAQTETELLGQLPLAKSIREQADAGKPTVVAEPAGEIAQLYRGIARRLAGKLSLQPKNYAGKFPKVVIEK